MRAPNLIPGGPLLAGELEASTDMYVLANSTAYDVFYTATGAINGNSISGATTTGTNFTGIIDGNDDMSGTWTNTQSSDNGTWSLIRTY